VFKERNCMAFLLSIIAIGVGGCAGGGASGSSTSPSGPGPSTLTGNWGIVTTSSKESPPITPYGAYLTQSEQSIAGSFSHEDGTGVTGVVSGTLSGNDLSLTLQDPSGLAIQVTATLTQGAFSGTYINGASGDQGTVSGSQIPSLAGSWRGTLTPNGMPNLTFNVEATLSEGALDQFGFPALTGTFTFSGTPCFSGGALTGDQRGPFIDGPGLDGGLSEEGQASIQTDLGIVVLFNRGNEQYTESNAAGTAITVVYDVYSGPCGGTFGSGTLNRQ
jgi:hypothetical protein